MNGKDEHRFWRRLGVMLSLIAMLFAMHAAGGAEIKSLPEHQIKAAYLFNFAKFVEWPKEAFSGPGAPIIIGIVGKDPLGVDLEKMVKGRTANGRKMVVQSVNELETMKRCHILFISAAEEKRWPEIQKAIAGISVLSVGESVRFTEAGGVISMTPGRRIGIEVNLQAAERARLVVSSHLRRVVTIIPTPPAPKPE